MNVTVCVADPDNIEDPLMRDLVERGEAKVARLIPVDEWEYSIYKVTYYRGGSCGDEENSRVCLVAYLLSRDNGIEYDADEHSPNCSWMKWEVVEEGIKPPHRKTEWGHSGLIGWGRHSSVVALKENYRIHGHTPGIYRRREIV